RRVSRAKRQEAVMDALKFVGLEKYATSSVMALSGGQQQRVAFARAIIGHPSLLLFDEPLSNLDAKLRAELRLDLQDFHRRLGNTSLYVTHDQTEALTLSDRIIVMKDGKIQQDGTPKEVFDAPANWFVADFVGFENIFPATITVG